MSVHIYTPKMQSEPKISTFSEDHKPSRESCFPPLLLFFTLLLFDTPSFSPLETRSYWIALDGLKLTRDLSGSAS